MALNGLYLKFKLGNTLFSIKYLIFFVSVDHLNLLLANVVVPPAGKFILVLFLVKKVQLSYKLIMFILISFISHLNSHCFLTFLLFN
jgi:hypothetical protein